MTRFPGLAVTMVAARRRATLWALCALLFLGTAWWLFGFSVSRSSAYIVIERRVFGRVTRMHILTKEWKEVERYLFPWSEPHEKGCLFTASLDDCAAIFPEVWEDRDQDGRWDTWRLRIGPLADGTCRVQYRADTTGDGKADLIFDAANSDYEEAAATIVAGRGF